MHSTTQMNAENMLSKTQVVPVVNNLPANEGYTRDESSIPGPKRSPGKGKKKTILVFLLGKKSMEGAWLATVHEAAKSQTQLSNTHTTQMNPENMLSERIP